MSTPKHIWNAQTTNRGSAHEQGLIIDEKTGANIAVSYKPEHARLIAAAPDLLEAVKDALPYLEACEQSQRYSADQDDAPGLVGQLLAAIEKAERSAQ